MVTDASFPYGIVVGGCDSDLENSLPKFKETLKNLAAHNQDTVLVLSTYSFLLMSFPHAKTFLGSFFGILREKRPKNHLSSPLVRKNKLVNAFPPHEDGLNDSQSTTSLLSTLGLVLSPDASVVRINFQVKPTHDILYSCYITICCNKIASYGRF